MELQTEVGEWAGKTFTEATNKSIIEHLRREVMELDRAALYLRSFNAPRPDADVLRRRVGEEAADCFLLLLHLSHRIGIDLEAVARQKHEINRCRVWSKPDAQGVCSHIEAKPGIRGFEGVVSLIEEAP